MRIAYLILTDKNPLLLKEVISALSSEECEFVIHVDKKRDINQFRQMGGGNVHFIESRIPVFWGEYSIAQAVFALIQKALWEVRECDYYVLLSGSDYPLRGGEYISSFFKRHAGAQFMSLINVQRALEDGGCARYSALRRLHHSQMMRITSDRPFSRLAMKAVTRLGLFRRDYRDYLSGLELFAGNTWWALTRDACKYILEFVDRNPNICKFFKYVFAPDEMLFQTIMGNSQFKDRILRNLTFEDWSPGEDVRSGHKAGFFERSTHTGGHPVTLSQKHIEIFKTNGRVAPNDIYGEGDAVCAKICR